MPFKVLHIYLVKKYIPPFFATLFIGMFIFFMIFVFTYIDEIAGKGIDNITLAKMFGYMFITFLPPSMPLAVLLSSIMTFGNLGENYELASMKSAGLSLLSIMRPLLILVAGLSVSCFLFSNYMLPFVHLKAGRLLYDVRASKPAFNLKESVFYNGIEGYSIRIGSKEKDGKTIHDVLIYDHTEQKGNVIQMYAHDGNLSMSADKRFLTIKLFNGTRYQQTDNDAKKEKTKPNMRMQFSEQEVKIDLSGFKTQQTDEVLFKNNAEMMNVVQLRQYMDTAYKSRCITYSQIYNQFTRQYYFQKTLTLFKKNDSIHVQAAGTINDYINKQSVQQRKSIIENALNLARSADSFLSSKILEEDREINEQANFATEWHKKFTISVACIILFFVGAPLGAIVRKGGFGMPVIISVFLFITYHVISFTCEKMVLQNKLNDVVGMWLGPVIFFPIGIWLSIKAANDSPLFDMTSYTDFIQKIKKRFYPQHAHIKHNQ